MNSSTQIPKVQNFDQGKSRFPQLHECSHFHYDITLVNLPKNFEVRFCSEEKQSTSLSKSQHMAFWYRLKITSNDKQWTIHRSYDDFCYLDKYLHECIYDRKFSCLQILLQVKKIDKSSENKLLNYLKRFCEIAFINPINCAPILNWFEIDTKGNRLVATENSSINIPSIAAAVVRKRYVSQDSDELSLEVGSIISIIDMPSADVSIWWRGKKEFEVYLF